MNNVRYIVLFTYWYVYIMTHLYSVWGVAFIQRRNNIDAMLPPCHVPAGIVLFISLTTQDTALKFETQLGHALLCT